MDVLEVNRRKVGGLVIGAGTTFALRDIKATMFPRLARRRIKVKHRDPKWAHIGGLANLPYAHHPTYIKAELGFAIKFRFLLGRKVRMPKECKNNLTRKINYGYTKEFLDEYSRGDGFKSNHQENIFFLAPWTVPLYADISKVMTRPVAF